MKMVNSFLLYAFITVINAIEHNYSLAVEKNLANGQQNHHEHKKYMGSFRYIRLDMHICTAFLISNKHLLTAAQCFETILESLKNPALADYSVKLGTPYLFHGGNYHSIEQVEVHKYYKYKEKNSLYDIGVITLLNEVSKSSVIDWISLPKEAPNNEMTAKVIGWKINDTECFDKSISLKSVEVLLKHHKECLLQITQPVQCAKLLQRSDELNLDDIGAPLVQSEKAIGVLFIIPSEFGEISYYVDLYRVSDAIESMQSSRIMKQKYANPRKRARYDWP